eukprot:Em0007g237a
MATCISSENPSSLQISSLETTILCSIETQKTSRSYRGTYSHSIQLPASDAKELLSNPELKPKGQYQQQVAHYLAIQTKTVGLVYHDWHHHQEIQVATKPAIVFLNDRYPSTVSACREWYAM